MRQPCRVGSHRLLSLIEEFVVCLAEVGIEHTFLMSYRRIVYPQRNARRQQRTGKHLLIPI